MIDDLFIDFKHALFKAVCTLSRACVGAPRGSLLPAPREHVVAPEGNFRPRPFDDGHKTEDF
jgi:hypothetical protein